MKKVTFIFIALAIVALLFADIEILTLDPWGELLLMLKGLIKPNFKTLYTIRTSILNTIVFAFCGLTLGVLGGIIISPFYGLRPVRYITTMLRSIHEIFWAFIFLPIVGLNPICGVLAIALPYSATFGKRFNEIFNETDLSTYYNIPGSRVTRFFYSALPLMSRDIIRFTSYRLECAFRSSAVLGFIGLPTLGFHLESYFSEGHYSEAAAILLLFYIIIGTKKYWLKAKLIPIYIILSAVFIPKDMRIVPENIKRFFTYDIIPWPIRRDGFFSGTRELTFKFRETLIWLTDLFKEEILPGTINTVILTQVAFVLIGVLAVFFTGLIYKKTDKSIKNRVTKLVILILRTTPEYIIAYVAIQLWGPSMFPGIVALVLHNSAVVTVLTIENIKTDITNLKLTKRRFDNFVFYILPGFYKSLLGNLFYRWEIMVRESSLLGILGIYTLGFYIDSAISDDKMDKALIIIIFMALLNIIINSVSRRVRKLL